MAVPATYLYDVFISCSDDDCDWVDENLLPVLEGAGLRVIVRHRDFAIGAPQITNIEWAVDQSRHTIIVLTPSWLASDWSAFEALLVQAGDPAARRRRLLPLLLKQCEPPDRIASLQAADFRVERFWENQSRRLVRNILDQGPPPPQPRHLHDIEGWRRWLWHYRRRIRRSTLSAIVLWLLVSMAFQLPPFFDRREGWQDLGLDTQRASAWRMTRAGDHLFATTTTDNSEGCASHDTGLWRQEPAHARWIPLAPPLNFETAKGCVRAAITALAADLASGRLFVTTDQRGLLRSDDDGDHWTVVDAPNLPQQLLSVVVAPAPSGHVFVAGWNQNIYASSDGGATWAQLNGTAICPASAAGSALPARLKVGALLATADAIYVGTDRVDNLYPDADDGLYASYDGGKCWKRVDSAAGRYTYKALAQIPGAKDDVLALTYDTLAASKGEAKYHLWRLRGGGRTFPLWQSLYVVQTIFVAPNAPPIWYAAGNLGDVYRGSIDGTGAIEQLHPFAFQARCFLGGCLAGLAPDTDGPAPLLLMGSRVYRRTIVPWYRRLWP